MITCSKFENSALAASIVRLYYAVELSISPDATYMTNLMGLWTYAEFITTIICSCMPSLARFAQHSMSSLLSLSHRLTSRGSSQSNILGPEKINRAVNDSGTGEEHGFGSRKYRKMDASVSVWELSDKRTPVVVSGDETSRV